jgi:hypothetical protein
MTLTVLNVTYALAPVGPDAIGGAEQVMSMLYRALVREGDCSFATRFIREHRIQLVAAMVAKYLGDAVSLACRAAAVLVR